MISKEKVRKEAMEARDSMDEESRQQKSHRIVEKILQLDCFRQADVVLSYHSFRSEVDVDALNRGILLQKKSLYLPKTFVKEKKIRFYQITDLAKLKQGYQKIREPMGKEPEFSWETIQKEKKKVIMIMPGTAYDARGYRMGYGGGYYDRYLNEYEKEWKHSDFCMIFVAFSEQKVLMVPGERCDVKPDIIVTDKENYVNHSKKGRPL
ncbi:MAG: 5-formyltetrahydrofolate cyclo-ligase [Clostridiales bacterium]|nr:5-formyltetrahydrofolate cyclo-ligase [Eubacterium sp.]MDD7348376.1 5-formyltetrahydrofolate cyclo-ligase [Clostridiales bacterium]MDY3775291.1 5-formyltetrahydrofolate cyclo-ligase [Eubacterium sp.]